MKGAETPRHARAPAGSAPGWSHEQSYRGVSLGALFHRWRLRGITRALRSLGLPRVGRLADFGCSDGFILEQLRARSFPGAEWRFYGFDNSRRMLARARSKHLPDTVFAHFELTRPDDEWADAFDMVLCLETLEHASDYEPALLNLWSVCKPGGRVLASIPVEVGVPGLLKFFGRRLAYRDPYSHFFGTASRWPYVRALLTGSDLSVFRSVSSGDHGSHFGFDNRCFEAFLRRELLEPGRFVLRSRRRIAFGLSLLYVLEKPAAD